MVSPQATRIRLGIVKIINKVGVTVTWNVHTTGGASATGYPGKVPTYTPKTIIVSLQPLAIVPKLLDLGYITDDERNIICKYTDVVSQTDQILWNNQTFTVTTVQDIPAFGDIVAYIVKIKRSATGA